MYAFLAFLAAFAPNVARLGDDSFQVREAETRRCDNPISVLLLPAPFTDSPEANDRIAGLKIRHRPLTQLQIEQRVMEDDFRRWIEQYVVLGRSAFSDRAIFVYLHAEWRRAEVFFEVWPLRHGDWSYWLMGTVMPGEYDCWRDHCDYHRGIAPMPREKK